MNHAIHEITPMPDHLKLHAEPCALLDALVEGEHYRFTILIPIFRARRVES
ncbi:hypothetical protein J7E73_29605 [Paenibacillus albidus]|uniref:hypothetical protein n=1 Tax=Paenibacillus albidus TaxID=2041023 RepID=UPI001BE95D82|nr:hypothetical protein [Paenibacillus albidus]MBT2293190.1 hypothetical protein [Paenibacillus albidus]